MSSAAFLSAERVIYGGNGGLFVVCAHQKSADRYTDLDPAGKTEMLTGRLGSTLTYDANGTLTVQGATTYTWNARNQLVATSAGGASFQYDALGRRRDSR